MVRPYALGLGLVGALFASTALAQTINQLPAASVPLAGTEPVAVWQGSRTKQVPVSAITASGPTTLYVTQAGAKCDGATDDTAAFTAAFAQATTVIVPGKQCYSSTGITIPIDHYLTGVSFSPANVPSATTSTVACPTSVAHCVTLGDGVSNAPSQVSELTVLGIGAANATSDGIYVNGGFNVNLQNVNVNNFGYLYHWKAYPVAGVGIGGAMINAYGGKADTADVWIDSWPELHMQTVRFGLDGVSEYNALACFLVSGGVGSTSSGPNTITLENSQCNPGVTPTQYTWYFRNLGSGGIPGIDAEGFKMTDDHFENIGTAFIGSDSSWNILERVFMSHVIVNQPDKPCLALNAATNPGEWQVSNNELFCSTFTINPSGSAIPINFLKFTANQFSGTFTVVSPTAGSVVNTAANLFGGNVSVSGAFGELNMEGDAFEGSTSFTATGGVQIIEQDSPTSAPWLGRANVFTNNQTVGTGTTFDGWITNGPAGVGRYSQFDTAGVVRWQCGEEGTAESGGNAGSDYYCARFADNGAFIDIPFYITRADGVVNAPNGLSIAGVSIFGARLKAQGGLEVTALLCSNTAPTVTSAGTSPSIIESNGTCSFTVNVGTGGTATTLVLALPTALSGWTCTAADVSTQSTNVFLQKQTAYGTTSATIVNYNTAGAPTAFVSGDHLRMSCLGD